MGELQNATAPQRKKRGGGLLVSILLIAIVALSYYAYTLYKEKLKTEETALKEKEMMLKDLSELQSDYDNMEATYGRTTEELKEERRKIALYIDSVKSMKADINALWKYRKQVQILQNERKKLLAQNDSLRRRNSLYMRQIDSTATALNVKEAILDSMAQKNTELAKIVQEGSVLSLSKLQVVGIKVKSNGKQVETARAKAVDKIKVCFTVTQNSIAEEGSRTFYTQIKDPRGVTIGKNDTTSQGDVTINFSSAKEFIYANVALDVCDFINLSNKEKGQYTVVVYDNELRELGRSEFSLK